MMSWFILKMVGGLLAVPGTLQAWGGLKQHLSPLFPLGSNPVARKLQFSLPRLLSAVFLSHQLSHSVTWKETRWKFVEAEVLQTGWLKWQHFFFCDAEATGQGVSWADFCSELSSVGRWVSIPLSSHSLSFMWVYIFSSYQVAGHIGLETDLYDLFLA